MKLYFTAEELNRFSKNSMISHFGMEFTEVTKEYLKVTMPVDERTLNPFKILHGGALMALAETAGSGLSVALVNPEEYIVKGMGINANHVKSVSAGTVTATATFLHRGLNTHIVEIKTRDENQELVSVGRITNFIQMKTP